MSESARTSLTCISLRNTHAIMFYTLHSVTLSPLSCATLPVPPTLPPNADPSNHPIAVRPFLSRDEERVVEGRPVMGHGLL